MAIATLLPALLGFQLPELQRSLPFQVMGLGVWPHTAALVKGSELSVCFAKSAMVVETILGQKVGKHAMLYAGQLVITSTYGSWAASLTASSANNPQP